MVVTRIMLKNSQKTPIQEILPFNQTSYIPPYHHTYYDLLIHCVPDDLFTNLV